MNDSGPRRLAIEAIGCPRLLIESADANSEGQAQLALKGDTETIARVLRSGSATTLIERIASERVKAEGDISSLAWLCFVINSSPSAPPADYALAGD